MARASKYPEELRERAVRMVAEFAPQYGSQWAAITAVAEKLGVGAPETDQPDPQPAGTHGGLTATASDPANKATMWTLLLHPAD